MVVITLAHGILMHLHSTLIKYKELEELEKASENFNLHSTLIKYKVKKADLMREWKRHLHSTLIKYKANVKHNIFIVSRIKFTFHSD